MKGTLSNQVKCKMQLNVLISLLIHSPPPPPEKKLTLNACIKRFPLHLFYNLVLKLI